VNSNAATGKAYREAEGGTVGDFFALLILFEDVVLLFLGRSDFGWRLGQGFFKNTSGPKGNNNIAGSDNRRRKRMATPIPVAHTQLNTFIASKMTKRNRKMSQASLSGSRTKFLMKCIIPS
jgi:hypothetical protein